MYWLMIVQDFCLGAAAYTVCNSTVMVIQDVHGRLARTLESLLSGSLQVGS